MVRVRGSGDRFGIFLERGEVAVDQAEQAQIDEHQFHRRVADALAEREWRRRGLGRRRRRWRRASWRWPGRGRCGRASRREFFRRTGFTTSSIAKFTRLKAPRGRGVADRVAQDDGARAGAYRGGVEA